MNKDEPVNKKDRTKNNGNINSGNHNGTIDRPILDMSRFKFHFFKYNFIMFIICLIWVIIIFAVPALLPANSVDLGSDGIVGTGNYVEDNEVQIKDIDSGFARSLYNFGDSSCHQKNNRSLFINGNQMPVCARDVGIYLGFAIGALIVTLMVVEMKMWWIIGALVPIGVDGLTQMFTFYESNNPLRLITGGLAGIMTTMVLGIMFYEIYVTSKMSKQRPQYIEQVQSTKKVDKEERKDD